MGCEIMRNFAKRQAYTMVRCWVRGAGNELDRVPYTSFHHKCVELGVPEEECEPLLRRLERSGTVVYAHGVVHINPNDVFADMHRRIGLEEELELDRRIEELELRMTTLDGEKEVVDRKIEEWRRKVWSRVAAYCGAQMWLFARFTFVDFEWDIMEPISWFVAQGNAVLFFAFLWRYGTEHSYTKFDDVVLPDLILRMYDSYGFDLQRWSDTRTELDALLSQRQAGLQGL
eukprot:TRINITY_DN23989_c0_g1_i2.p1 TRINITY_DN23989_c0_g1~~TRINITY_DN23989_c0_g1_i2.p1  ORF type:complete len:230 (+),score=72.57 TRINITY_DN23989_c0_g1_i2:129-818(+)